jgi:hypothetical protein
VRWAVIGGDAMEEALPASDPSASDRSRQRRHAGLRLWLVRCSEEGDDEGQIQSSGCGPCGGRRLGLGRNGGARAFYTGARHRVWFKGGALGAWLGCAITSLMGWLGCVVLGRPQQAIRARQRASSGRCFQAMACPARQAWGGAEHGQYGFRAGSCSCQAKNIML